MHVLFILLTLLMWCMLLTTFPYSQEEMWWGVDKSFAELFAQMEDASYYDGNPKDKFGAGCLIKHGRVLFRRC